MSNIIPTQQSRTPKKSSVRVIFSFEKEFMFGGPLEFGSALGLSKVRDLQKYDRKIFKQAINGIFQEILIENKNFTTNIQIWMVMNFHQLI